MKKFLFAALCLCAVSAHADVTQNIISRSTFSVQPGATISVRMGRIDTLYTNNIVSTNAFSPISVKSFGAKGDGTTNDRTAIQNAIDAASSQGGGIVYFPPGIYICAGNLTPKSTTTIQGSGPYNTIISLPQSDINPMDYSLFETTHPLYGFSIRDIGLRGNNDYQTTALTSNNDDDFALQLNKNSTSNLSVENCHIYQWGIATSTDPSPVKGGGAIAIIPDATAPNGNLNNIRILNNEFGFNYNIAGIYVQPYVPATGFLRGLFINGNRFQGGGGQNIIHVLGSILNPARDIHIESNQFALFRNADGIVALEGTDGAVVTGNTFRNTSTGAGTPLQISGYEPNLIVQRNFVIDGNTFLNENTSDRTAITILGYQGDSDQTNMVISNNVIYDFGKTTDTAAAVYIGQGSKYVNAIGNIIGGSQIDRAFAVQDSSFVIVSDNIFQNSYRPIEISGGTLLRNIDIRSNFFIGCGSSTGTGLISTRGGAINIENLHVRLNRSTNSIQPSSFTILSVVSDTGNWIYDNHLDIDLTNDGTVWEKIYRNNGFTEDYISSCTIRSTPIATSTDTAKNVARVLLPIGEWDIRGAVGWRTLETTENFYAGINITANTLGPGDTFSAFENGVGVITMEGLSVGTGKDFNISLPTSRIRINTNSSPVYLIQMSNGDNNAYGCIEAQLQ